MNEKQNETDEHRARRRSDLLQRRDRILVHKDLGPKFRRWEASRSRMTNNGAIETEFVDEVEAIVNRATDEVVSVMKAADRILLDKVFVRKN